MSLINFIKTELSPEDKQALIKDKNVCLCLFRVAFTPLEQ
jgi:hypothetical protein